MIGAISSGTMADFFDIENIKCFLHMRVASNLLCSATSVEGLFQALSFDSLFLINKSTYPNRLVCFRFLCFESQKIGHRFVSVATNECILEPSNTYEHQVFDEIPQRDVSGLAYFVNRLVISPLWRLSSGKLKI
ncbi:unnamed protein product [Lactuca virosa]|uniref:Uncharacterized protein n=1 Tax=Lactuca virosa TaxID=75947 RepID=A0AAU9MTV8_9ASTR|nr:unnamed protein product [Lactuca virosa]